MTAADRTIDSIGLPAHPKPRDLAKEMRDLARLLDDDLARAIRIAPLLAARGWAGGTLGDGTGSRGSDTTTSVERAAGVTQDVHPADIRADRFADADIQLHTYLAVIHRATMQVTKLAGDLLAHADDVDEVPAGTGHCECCNRFCRPTGEKPDDRLRGGLCPACRKAWDRAGKPERGQWMLTRRVSLREALARGRSPQEILRLEEDQAS